jgi:hypothetical protein
MARKHKAVYRRRFRQPSFLNNLLFELSLFPIFNPMSEFPMSTSRRNVLIRTISTIAGDIATGLAVASACVWIIESAALGLFLSFLLWLIGTLLALALSQYVVHPALTVMLSDSKLDLAVDAVTLLGNRFTRFTRSVLQTA